MRVAIVNLSGGSLSGGYWKYLQNLLPLLYKDDRVAKLSVFVPPHLRNVQLPGVFHLNSWPYFDVLHGYRHLKEQITKLNFDVVYFPTARWINCGKVPVVIMVRNMEPLVMPFVGNMFCGGIRNIFRAYMARKACQRAKRVIAVSEHVRTFILEKFRIHSDKIAVVYHGTEKPLGIQMVSRPNMIKKKVIVPFLFTAGSIRPARGLEDIIKAFDNIKQQIMGYKLVIAGTPNPETQFYKKDIDILVYQLGLASNVIWAGQLNRLEISWCYLNCSAFVMTSRVEACPNIALEAMSYGAIIISSDNPPLPEFFADAAVYYPSKDGKALAGVIRNVLTWDNHQRNKASERARKRAAEFSWNVCAEKTIAELAKAAEI